jgi:hypothetical protein
MSPQSQSPPSGGPRTGWESRPDAGTNPMPPPHHPADAIRDAMAKLTELREFAAYYVAAKVDAIKLTARRIGILIALGLMGAVVGATVLIVSVVLLLEGIAGAFGAIFPSHAWLGDLITAVIFLAIPVIGVLVGMRILTKTFKTSTVQKYERRQSQQRQQFGRDVRDQATQP